MYHFNKTMIYTGLCIILIEARLIEDYV